MVECVWYYVKWVGFPSTDDSWVKDEDMNCPELIVAFNTAQEKGKEQHRNKIQEGLRRSREEREASRKEEEERKKEEDELKKQQREEGVDDAVGSTDGVRRSGRKNPTRYLDDEKEGAYRKEGSKRRVETEEQRAVRKERRMEREEGRGGRGAVDESTDTTACTENGRWTHHRLMYNTQCRCRWKGRGSEWGRR
jgi:hypothetical protein